MHWFLRRKDWVFTHKLLELSKELDTVLQVIDAELARYPEPCPPRLKALKYKGAVLGMQLHILEYMGKRYGRGKR